ncbi:MAG TPA: MBL fold metallo-hydrolase [Candidatus Limnocylindrales bacterium]|nr:MBL fold metallo-hydrolase [Candidatus Limnocylindrales bacterium]
MLVRFWGVRGSTPTPQSENLRYGGNTSCVEVRVNGHIYVFDCGTGFRNLGKQLSLEHAADGKNGHPINAHIFLSHFHWDHIQGIPFFSPLYNDRDSSFIFHSSSRTRGLQQALEEQMADPYFPVNMSEMAAHRQFCTVDEGRTQLEGCTVETKWLNHPQGCLGFRMETQGKVIVYATDNEPGDPVFDKSVRKLAEGADLLIYDAQYLPEEYAARKQGWGHSHWREAINVVMESGAKELILFHHDPDHTDSCIDAVVKQAREYYPKVRAASEGMEIVL